MSTILIGFAIYSVFSFLAAFGIAKAFFQSESVKPQPKCMSRHVPMDLSHVKRFKFSKA